MQAHYTRALPFFLNLLTFNNMKKFLFLLTAMLFFVAACEKENYSPNPGGNDSVEFRVIGTPSTPVSDGGVTPYIIPPEYPGKLGSNGGNRDCADVAAAFGASFIYSSDKVDYENGAFQGSFPAGLNVTVEEGKYVSFSGTVFWKNKTLCVGAVIVKGGNDANVYYYPGGSYGDSGLAAPLNPNGMPAGLSNLTFCFVVCGEQQPCWDDETAWAAGRRYVTRGNWATYTPYVAGSTVTLFAGQTLNAGTVAFSAVNNGQVTITITLNSGWRFGLVNENVKIQGYASAPSGNPAPGLFANKATATGSPFSITVPAANFYGVHVDVDRLVPCTEE